jgi:hypothetical protein
MYVTKFHASSFSFSDGTYVFVAPKTAAKYFLYEKLKV